MHTNDLALSVPKLWELALPAHVTPVMRCDRSVHRRFCLLETTKFPGRQFALAVTEVNAPIQAYSASSNRVSNLKGSPPIPLTAHARHRTTGVSALAK